MAKCLARSGPRLQWSRCRRSSIQKCWWKLRRKPWWAGKPHGERGSRNRKLEHRKACCRNSIAPQGNGKQALTFQCGCRLKPGERAMKAWLEAVVQDLRYGARQLRANKAFAVVAILSLALGIGANTAIFQLIDAVRLRTLPVKDPDTLARS